MILKQPYNDYTGLTIENCKRLLLNQISPYRFLVSTYTGKNMQYTTLALGFAIVFYSLYITYASFKTPSDLIRLKYMRDKFGLRAGTIIHTITYIIVPFIFGCFILSAGVEGLTIQQFITGNAPIS